VKKFNKAAVGLNKIFQPKKPLRTGTTNTKTTTSTGLDSQVTPVTSLKSSGILCEMSKVHWGNKFFRKESRRLGLGVAQPTPSVIYVVGNYDPPGNIVGADNFRRNVADKK
jgi:hypothetical protein